MIHRLARTFLIALMLGSIAGCATLDNHNRNVGLRDRAKLYMKAIRWSEFAVAADMLKRRDGATPVVNLDALKGVRVTSEDYLLAAEDPDATEARMRADFEYQRADSATVRKVRQEVLWWWDEGTEQWYMEGTLPEFL